MTVRISNWIHHFNLKIVPIQDRPDAPPPQSDIVYVIKDVFTTRDGSWDPSSIPGSVTHWARDAYLRPWSAPDRFDDAGGDHHLFGRVEGLDGKFIPDAPVIYWSDGLDKLADPNYNSYTHRDTKTHSGWCNIPISGGSSFVPERGESGPWSWCPQGAPAEVLVGGGMPAKWHVSFFAVWKAVRRAEWEQSLGGGSGGSGGSGDGGGAGDGGGDTGGGTPEVPVDPVPESPSQVYPPGEAGVRQSAWDTVGVNYNPDAAFSRYAREHKLGIPLANEYDVNDFRVQPFVGGIVFARIGDWGNIQHISW